MHRLLPLSKLPRSTVGTYQPDDGDEYKKIILQDTCSIFSPVLRFPSGWKLSNGLDMMVVLRRTWLYRIAGGRRPVIRKYDVLFKRGKRQSIKANMYAAGILLHWQWAGVCRSLKISDFFLSGSAY